MDEEGFWGERDEEVRKGWERDEKGMCLLTAKCCLLEAREPFVRTFVRKAELLF